MESTRTGVDGISPPAVASVLSTHMYRVIKESKQVGRTCKSLEAAEAAVQRQYGKSLNGSGAGRIDIVDADDNIIRVFYVN